VQEFREFLDKRGIDTHRTVIAEGRALLRFGHVRPWLVQACPERVCACGAVLLSRPAMSDNPTLAISINGEPRQVSGGISVAAMLEELGLDRRKVAVERNLEVIPRSLLGDVAVANGDTYEIVKFVGGG
jgi:thiazole synthase